MRHGPWGEAGAQDDIQALGCVAGEWWACRYKKTGCSLGIQTPIAEEGTSGGMASRRFSLTLLSTFALSRVPWAPAPCSMSLSSSWLLSEALGSQSNRSPSPAQLTTQFPWNWVSPPSNQLGQDWDSWGCHGCPVD